MGTKTNPACSEAPLWEGSKAKLYHGVPLMMDDWLPVKDVTAYRDSVAAVRDNLIRAAQVLHAWLDALEDPGNVKVAAVILDVMRRYNVANPEDFAGRHSGTRSIREARRAVARELLDAGTDIRLVRAILGGRSARTVMFMAGNREKGRRGGR